MKRKLQSKPHADEDDLDHHKDNLIFTLNSPTNLEENVVARTTQHVSYKRRERQTITVVRG